MAINSPGSGSGVPSVIGLILCGIAVVAAWVVGVSSGGQLEEVEKQELSENRRVLGDSRVSYPGVWGHGCHHSEP